MSNADRNLQLLLYTHHPGVAQIASCCVQTKFDWQANGVDERPLISYGPCQFPTLGLIVQRAWYSLSYACQSAPCDLHHVTCTI
jgi:hypothetical protein